MNPSQRWDGRGCRRNDGKKVRETRERGKDEGKSIISSTVVVTGGSCLARLCAVRRAKHACLATPTEAKRSP